MPVLQVGYFLHVTKETKITSWFKFKFWLFCCFGSLIGQKLDNFFARSQYFSYWKKERIRIRVTPAKASHGRRQTRLHRLSGSDTTSSKPKARKSNMRSKEMRFRACSDPKNPPKNPPTPPQSTLPPIPSHRMLLSALATDFGIVLLITSKPNVGPRVGAYLYLSVTVFLI